MTTKAAENLYLAQHLYAVEGKGYAVYNPNDKPLTELPVIYGFNNGGRPGWFQGELVAEDGRYLGGHSCSHEGYMGHDLGILEGSRPDRHEDFKKHYPDGYRMDFVSHEDVTDHPQLTEAIKRYEELKQEEVQDEPKAP